MKVSELLDSPEKWTQKASARADDGSERCPWHSDATSWCLLGAVSKCYEVKDADVRVEVYEKLRNALEKKFHRTEPLAFWNDDPARTFDDIKALLEEAGV